MLGRSMCLINTNVLPCFEIMYAQWHLNFKWSCFGLKTFDSSICKEEGFENQFKTDLQTFNDLMVFLKIRWENNFIF